MAHTLASAVFDSRAEAERAIADLRQAGVRDSALSVVAQDEGKTTTTSGDGHVVDEGHGSLIRGLLGGGALGAGLGVAALAIPGVGPLVGAGAIAAAVVPEAMGLGAAIGAASSGLAEVLNKRGVSREDADYYSNSIKSGGIFVSVDDDGGNVSASMVRDILYRHGGHSSTQARGGMTGAQSRANPAY